MNKYLLLFCLLFSLSASAFAANTFVVVIDAGHGGRDGGATRNKMKEKDINLGVALQLGKLIESNVSNVKVIYTRKTDVFVDLIKRTEIANKEKANLFISIHTNSTEATTTTAAGADTYILGISKTDENLRVAKRENSVILLEDNYSKKYEGFDPSSPESYIIFEFMVNKHMDQSLEFAKGIQKNIKSLARRTDRGVRQAGFLVLKNTSMPSVLIELGFINNPTEAKYLISTSGQRVMANSIFAAFKSYKEDFDRKQGSASFEKPPSSSPTPKIAVVDTPKQIETNLSISKEKIPVSKMITSKTQRPTEEAETKSSDTPAAESDKVDVAAQKINSNQIEYRVQFLISTKELSNTSVQFKGLAPVSSYKEGNSYKYTYGSTANLNESIRLQREARRKFPDAFVVKFKNGERF